MDKNHQVSVDVFPGTGLFGNPRSHRGLRLFLVHVGTERFNHGQHAWIRPRIDYGLKIGRMLGRLGDARDARSASESEKTCGFSSMECCKSLELQSRPVGFEPTTYRFEVCHSIQLSYGR